MKKAYLYTPPIIESTQSKVDVNSWQKSIDLFSEKKFFESFTALMDYINPELRKKYSNKEGTEYNIPHWSIKVNIKIDNNIIKISAPFLKVSDDNRVVLLRQVADLNMNYMILAQLYLKDNKLFFEYELPLELAEPYKTYYIFEDICYAWDKYDDEFVSKFKASRIYEPEVKEYDNKTIDYIYNEIQKTCDECLSNLKEFEEERKFGFAWNLVDTAILKILYFASPQWQLLNELNKAKIELDRDEKTPLSQIVAEWKVVVEKVSKMTKEEIKKSLYFVETFIAPKRRSTLPNVQDNFKNSYERAEQYMWSKDYMTASIIMTNKFYQMYFYNNVQEDINRVVVKALKESSEQSFEKSAKILFSAMKKIMEGKLSTNSWLFSKLFS